MTSKSSIIIEEDKYANKEAIGSIIIRLYGSESGPISIKKALSSL